MRKLASIQKITAIRPIDGAESIEVAQILGWEVVVKKGEFKDGDMVCYVEVDSILPEKPEFEFMRSRKFRVRTVKLRGQISQGIAFPLSILPDGEYYIDADVTNLLGVKKWEPYEEIKQKTDKPKYRYITVPRWFPAGVIRFWNKKFKIKIRKKKTFDIWSYIPKTGETRVQVLGNLLQSKQGESCYVTEKLDGSSVTFYLKDGVFGVCSRNIDLERVESGNQFWNAAINLDIENKMKHFSKCSTLKNFALQGELIGSGIQGNKYKLTNETKVYFFDVWDFDNQKYLGSPHIGNMLYTMGLDMVPILDIDFTLVNDIPALIKYATRKSIIRPDIWAEGVVIRTVSGNCGRDRISFKCINPEFLLKYEE